MLLRKLSSVVTTLLQGLGTTSFSPELSVAFLTKIMFSTWNLFILEGNRFEMHSSKIQRLAHFKVSVLLHAHSSCPEKFLPVPADMYAGWGRNKQNLDGQ